MAALDPHTGTAVPHTAASRLHQRFAAHRPLGCRSSGPLGDDVLGQMLQPSARYGLLPEEAILDTLPGITIATFETPSRAAGWILLHLARYPQAADRVAAEAALLPADPAATTSTHLDCLQYTQALVREVLRLHPRAGY